MFRTNNFRTGIRVCRVIKGKDAGTWGKMELRSFTVRGAKHLNRAWIAVALLSTTIPTCAQTSPPTLAFDVASVKPDRSAAEDTNANFPLGPGDVYAANGGNFITTNFPLIVYINFAYRVTANQQAALRKHLPDWVLNERFDITAKTDKHDATKDEMRQMMRSLLAERFHLQIHSEDEEQSVYALELVKPGTLGPKLQPHPPGDTCAHTPQEVDASRPRPALYLGEAVYPTFCGGVMGDDGKVPGTLALAARDVPLSLIATTLAGPGGLDRPVVDRTGLTGKFDFLLEFAPDRRPQPGDATTAPLDVAGPGIAQALKQQLGLKLVPTKAPVQVWVVDHIEHATEN
jgi:uncharacterized protein (TIGR03435 family)